MDKTEQDAAQHMEAKTVMDEEFIGREVSTKAIEGFFQESIRRGLPQEALTAGVDYSLEYLLDQDERIDWESYRTIAKNFAGTLDDEQGLVDYGSYFIQSSVAKPFAIVAKLLYSPVEFYSWVVQPKTGPGNIFMSCVDGKMREIEPRHLVVELAMHPGYAVCREFFLITQGIMIALPSTLGLGESSVQMEEIQGGIRYRVQVPEGGGRLAWLRKAITWPFTARSAAAELKEAHELLLDRYQVMQNQIEERRQVEGALRENELLYRALFENSNDAVFLMNLDQTYMAVNQQGADLLGYPPDKLVGMSVSQFIVPDETQDFSNVYNALMSGESLPIYERLIRRKDGVEIPVEVNVAMVRDSEGNPAHLQSVVRDISERKKRDLERSHLLAAESEQRLQAETLAGVTLALTSQIDHKAVLDEILHQVKRIVPYKTANIALREGENLRIVRWQGYDKYTSEDLIADLIQPYSTFPLDEKVLKSKKALIIEDVLEHPDWVQVEGISWIRSHLSIPLCLHEEPLGLLRLDGIEPGEFSQEDAERLNPLANAAAVALENARLFEQILLEINERQRVENELLAYTEQLENLRQVGLGIISELDLETLLGSISERVIELLKGDAGALHLHQPNHGLMELTVSINNESAVVGSKVDFQKGIVGTVWELGEAVIIADYNNWERRLPMDGEYKFPAIISVPIGWGDQLLGVLSVYSTQTGKFSNTDANLLTLFADQAAIAIKNARLHEQTHMSAVHLETRVLERTAQLEETNKELEAFAYSISHDLRAPLRATSGYSSILIEDYSAELPEEVKRYLNLIRENARQMDHLIIDLLDFSRLSRQQLIKKPVKPNDLIEPIINELKPEWKGRKVEFKVGDLPDCTADPVLLKQVFTNLLSNAVKFTRLRDNSIVVVDYEEIDGKVVYFIRDNGVGFNMQYSDKLFGVFQRLHSANEYEGTGVGLAIVQRILHRHGGQIWAIAEDGKGATFYFTLGD
ncbi:MAG: GAF domain-containing protein [Chloroflexi bacterium]|nr:GAF domain-containing protein [Chloroflexota bacterium]